MATSTLVTTAGSASANSYCDVATANQYHSDRPPVGTTWADAVKEASEEPIRAALIHATRLLDLKIRWAGAPATSTQALQWPRYGLYTPVGAYIESTVIPVQIQHATAELARHLLTASETLDNDAQSNALEEMATLAKNVGIGAAQVGDVSITMSERARRKDSIPEEVFWILPSQWYVTSLGVPVERA